MTIAEDIAVTVEDIGFPPPPAPDITLPFAAVLEMMRVLRLHADVVEGRVPDVEQSVASFRAVADRLDHAVAEAGWSL